MAITSKHNSTAVGKVNTPAEGGIGHKAGHANVKAGGTGVPVKSSAKMANGSGVSLGTTHGNANVAHPYKGK